MKKKKKKQQHFPKLVTKPEKDELGKVKAAREALLKERANIIGEYETFEKKVEQKVREHPFVVKCHQKIRKKQTVANERLNQLAVRVTELEGVLKYLDPCWDKDSDEEPEEELEEQEQVEPDDDNEKDESQGG